MSSSQYTYSDKLYIYNMLNKITDYKQMNNILKIIIKNDKDNIIEKDKGTYIKISNLQDETYNNLEKYIKKLQENNIKN